MNNHNHHRDLLVGVDVGGTKVAVLVVDSHYQVRAEATSSTVLDSPRATLRGIAEAVRQAVGQAGADMSQVARVGVGVPGRVDPRTGSVRRAVNLGWEDLPAGRTLSAQLDVLCVLENDVTLAAAGAQRYVGGPAAQNMVYVSVGTGIAAGLILDGRIYRGAHGLAGEIGHMVIDPNGPLCRCGGSGCLESLAAGPAIARMGEEAATTAADTLLSRHRPVTAEAVYQAAREGDSYALTITHKVARYLALAVQQLIVSYDVECIVFGGGVSRNGDAFLQPILEELARLRDNSVLTNEMLQHNMILLLPPDYAAGAWGAALLASGDLTRTIPASPPGGPTGDGHSARARP
jgi:glucokinase